MNMQFIYILRFGLRSRELCVTVSFTMLVIKYMNTLNNVCTVSLWFEFHMFIDNPTVDTKTA